MKEQFEEQIRLIESVVADSSLLDRIEMTISYLTDSLENRLPVLVFGNGGSAADALHITGELVGRFYRERKAMNVICLNSNVTVITAWANDYEYETNFARQVEADRLARRFQFDCFGARGPHDVRIERTRKTAL